MNRQGPAEILNRHRPTPYRPRRGVDGTGFGLWFLRRKTSQPPDQTKQRVRSGPLHTGIKRRTQAAGGFEALNSASQNPNPKPRGDSMAVWDNGWSWRTTAVDCLVRRSFAVLTRRDQWMFRLYLEYVTICLCLIKAIVSQCWIQSFL